MFNLKVKKLTENSTDVPARLADNLSYLLATVIAVIIISLLLSATGGVLLYTDVDLVKTLVSVLGAYFVFLYIPLKMGLYSKMRNGLSWSFYNRK